jgi:hypothetical protein
MLLIALLILPSLAPAQFRGFGDIQEQADQESALAAVPPVPAYPLATDGDLPFSETWDRNGTPWRQTIRQTGPETAEVHVQFKPNRYANEWATHEIVEVTLESARRNVASKRLNARLAQAAQRDALLRQQAAAERARRDEQDRRAYHEPRRYTERDANGRVIRTIEEEPAR